MEAGVKEAIIKQSGCDENKDLEMALIQFQFKNSNLVNVLTARGDTIKNDKVDKLNKFNQRLQNLKSN